MNPSFWREAYEHFPGFTLLFEINAEGVIEPIFVSKRAQKLLGFSPLEYLDVLQEPSQISQGVNDTLDVLANSVGENPEGTMQATVRDRYGEEKKFLCCYEMFRLKSGRKRFLRLTFLEFSLDSDTGTESFAETFKFNSHAFLKVKQQVSQTIERGQSVLILAEEDSGANDLLTSLFGIEIGEVEGSFGMRRVQDRLTKAEKVLIFNLEKAVPKELEEMEATILGQCFVITSTTDMLTIWKNNGLSTDRLYEHLPVTVMLPPLRVRLEDAESYFCYQLKKINAFLPQFTAKRLPDGVRINKTKITEYLLDELQHHLAVMTSNQPKGTDLFGHEESNGNIEPFDIHVKKYLLDVLKATDGKIYGINGAAKRLKLKPTTLQSKLKKLGIR